MEVSDPLLCVSGDCSNQEMLNAANSRSRINNKPLGPTKPRLTPEEKIYSVGLLSPDTPCKSIKELKEFFSSNPFTFEEIIPKNPKKNPKFQIPNNPKFPVMPFKGVIYPSWTDMLIIVDRAPTTILQMSTPHP